MDHPSLIVWFSQEERDKKEQEKSQRKQEAQKILEQEEATINASKSRKNADLIPKKVTQAQIQQRQTEMMTKTTEGTWDRISIESDFDLVFLEPKRRNLSEDEEDEIEENINHLTIDGASARNVDEAIHILK